MRISIKSHDWEKVPVIGSFVGIKEVFIAGKKLVQLAAKDKTSVIGSKIFKYEEAFQQAASRLLRGAFAIVPILGGSILAIYDKYVRKMAREIYVPFPNILLQDKVDVSIRCANLRDLNLVNEIFDTEKVAKRLDPRLKEKIPTMHNWLKEEIRKIAKTGDKQELKLLKKAWIKALGQNISDDCLAKLNFTPENIQKLGFQLLEDAWIENIRHTQYNNSMIEVTRYQAGVSDISMAACFSVLAKYPQLKSSPYDDSKSRKYEDIKLIQIKNTNDFATPLACQTLANLIAANREDLQGIKFPKADINGDRAQEIAQGFAHNHYIWHIEMLGNTNLGDKGAIAICQGLHAPFHHPNHAQPCSLDLRSCSIGDGSIEALLNLAKGASNQVTLDLSFNEFTEEGKTKLREEIARSNTERPENSKITLYLI